MPLARSRLEILQIRKLIQCVRSQDVAQIIKLIQMGINGLVNYQDPSTGDAPLHVAVIQNYDAVATQLLGLGADPGVQDLEGRTVVMRACEYGHVQALDALASKSINTTVVDNKGRTALFHCLHSTSRHARCIGFLLECGADPNTKDSHGLPILYAACEKGLDRILEKLLDKGADPNAREPAEGKPAIVVATEGNHLECLKLLMTARVDLNAAYGDMKLCALHRAAALGLFEVIQLLSAYGANFAMATASGENAMHFATAANNLLIIRLLGQRGCPAGAATVEGVTPQKIAKTEGFKDCMKELKKLTSFQDKVAKGSKPKGFSEHWCIQLYDWIQTNKRAVLDLLRSQDQSANFTLPTDAFSSTLEQASVPLGPEELKKLVSVCDKKGEGVLNYDDLLSDHKYINIQFKLGPHDNPKAKKKAKKGKKSKGKAKANIPFPIYYEAERPPTAGVADGTIEKEQFLTDMQRFPRDKDLPHLFVDDSAWYLAHPDHQYVQMYEAIRHGDLESLLSALAEGIPVDCRDKYNKTPLMVACAHARPEMVKFFLERGADVNAIDNFLWTPLHHASHSGQLDIVKMLLDAGANMDAQSVNGGTALMRAIETCQREIVKLLLEWGAKVTLENKNGLTALDVAKNWGDEVIFSVVYARAASLPPPVEKKGLQLLVCLK